MRRLLLPRFVPRVPSAAALAVGALRLCATVPPPGAKGGAVDSSPDTHPDFQAKIPKFSPADAAAADEAEVIKKDIRDTIATEDIVLFMKGLPEAPVCGFSKKLVDILEVLGVEYTSFDVLAHPVVRVYVKEISDWPTIPQLFIKGEFVGGVDVCVKLAEEGDLQMLLDKHGLMHRGKLKG
jgi:monothiol glutaredoxin